VFVVCASRAVVVGAVAAATAVARKSSNVSCRDAVNLCVRASELCGWRGTKTHTHKYFSLFFGSEELASDKYGEMCVQRVKARKTDYEKCRGNFVAFKLLKSVRLFRLSRTQTHG
jgi:hypothetical protein